MTRNDASDLFLDVPSGWDGPPLTAAMVARAEQALGVRLPAAYLDVLSCRNGGLLRRSRFPLHLSFQKSAASMTVLMGIGGDRSIDTPVNGEPLNRALIRNWRYPETGIVVSHFGHEGFALDYAGCGPEGDPSVVYCYAESWPNVLLLPVCRDFSTFLAQLTVPPNEA